jgi:hypothetical protein
MENIVMTADPGAKIAQPKSPDLSHLPDILDLQVHARRFDPPRRFTTNGIDGQADAGIEVEVKLSEPFLIRALSPVLWIGEQPLTEMECTGNTCRFYAFDPQRLTKDGPIALSWGFSGAPRKMTNLHYRPPTTTP